MQYIIWLAVTACIAIVTVLAWLKPDTFLNLYGLIRLRWPYEPIVDRDFDLTVGRLSISAVLVVFVLVAIFGF